ncbi:SMI1/KNR4 family protein [[Actinomadura] parvosata]|uniref:SMI1/KNR4 family protein n=1 Tax=[Actinomadura] parvosata TaxID=1955412 RepID=UPI0012BC1960|nr:SMI1/KNR4 family protein [Nonomuraea sp. ATCC 55076]
MLKLVRLALTAAILTAIAVRLRRRARMPERLTVPPAPAPAARRTRMGLVWAGIAGIVAVTLTAALLPDSGRPATTGHAGQAQARAQTLTQAPSQPPTQAPAQAPTQAPTQAPAQVPSAAPTATPDPGCSPAPRPVTVRPIDPRVRQAVNRQWRRIERWLKANAPRTYRTLGAPGRARTIAIAEAQMGVDFPDDLRASLLRHNGSRGAYGFGLGFWSEGATNLSTREIRDAWRALCARQRTDPAGEHWNGRLIPFLYQREEGTFAAVDSAGGAVVGGATEPRMPSYHALVRAVADALEQGTPLEGRRPAVTRGLLRWEQA